MACKAGAAGLFLSETSARLSGQRGQRARKKTAAMEVRIIMVSALYHMRGRVQPARGGALRGSGEAIAARYWPT
jgi:hypothetical protein